jgi:hypothetical protein
MARPQTAGRSAKALAAGGNDVASVLCQARCASETIGTALFE